MREVTYREFSKLANKRGWTVEMLVELFKGRTGIEDRGSAVIAYRSVIEFYRKELQAGSLKLCVCGCGRPAKLGDYALKRCRYRRLKVSDTANA